MTTRHPALAFIAALLMTIVCSVAALAADTSVTWPLRWKAGDAWTYESEYLDSETTGGDTMAMRATSRTTVRIEEAGANGYTQVWSTQGTAVEAVEGDRTIVDLMAPMTERLDAVPVVAELDARGQYRRIRNLKAIAGELRSVMVDLGASAVAAASPQQADNNAKQAQPALSDAELQQLLPLDTAETMLSAEIKAFNRYIGESYTLGERDYATLEMVSDGGIVMIGDSDYSVTIDPQDPSLARIQWTHVLDQERDARTLWDYAQELSGEEIPRSARKGRPKNLELREQGFALFRRDTGAVVMMENETFSRYGDVHRRTQRARMRASDFAREW